MVSCYCLYKGSQPVFEIYLSESSSSGAYFGVTLLNSKFTRFELQERQVNYLNKFESSLR